MRYFLIALFFAAQLLSACAAKAEVVGTFTPLKDNERFAYGTEGVTKTDGSFMREITFFAVRNNDTTDISRLFTWENIDDSAKMAQFADNLRTVFFVTDDGTIYMATGDTGEIKKLRTVIPPRTSLRFTEDGRFGAFVAMYDCYTEAAVSVFDIETETVKRLTWKVNGNIQGSWDVFRYGSVFYINGGYEVEGSQALAELDPSTMELKVLWDRTNQALIDPDAEIPPPPPSPHAFFNSERGFWDIWDDVIVINPDIELWRK